tara:strand:- start:662 stop:814 length:153 start_codon:yes stop_codon:yes gene_type:complete
MQFTQYYQSKSDQSFKSYNQALDSNNEKAAAQHMTDYLNYQEALTKVQPS